MEVWRLVLPVQRPAPNAPARLKVGQLNPRPAKPEQAYFPVSALSSLLDWDVETIRSYRVLRRHRPNPSPGKLGPENKTPAAVPSFGNWVRHLSAERRDLQGPTVALCCLPPERPGRPPDERHMHDRALWPLRLCCARHVASKAPLGRARCRGCYHICC